MVKRRADKEEVVWLCSVATHTSAVNLLFPQLVYVTNSNCIRNLLT
jgi:hypothetical protein